MEFEHYSVLLNETINALEIKPTGIYVDGTAGGAGHSKEIAKRLTTGRLIALDRDPDAVAVATERLKGLPAQVIESNFKDMDRVLDTLGHAKVEGILLDLGVSSFQLDEAQRGFSFHKDAPLDMRMSKEGMTAADLLASCQTGELTKILRDYGEERFAYQIAKAICERQQKQPFSRTVELADFIAAHVPASARRDGHPARRTFQALRIAVNGELDNLHEVLDKAFDRLAPGGVLAILTFHSLEDRMVKQAFKEYCTGCICPKDIPVCVCGRKPRGELVFRKSVQAGPQELQENPRSRSARLRAIRKL